jgi:hypothetical protein
MTHHLRVNSGSYFRDVELVSNYKVRARTEICFSRDSRFLNGSWNLNAPWANFLSDEVYFANNIPMNDATVLVALLHLLCL